VLGQDGALYLTTDNGDGEDQLLKVTPSQAG
jgi:aldose sugar dehydrogenase